MHTVGPEIWQKSEKLKNEKPTLLDLEYGRKQ